MKNATIRSELKDGLVRLSFDGSHQELRELIVRTREGLDGKEDQLGCKFFNSMMDMQDLVQSTIFNNPEKNALQIWNTVWEKDGLNEWAMDFYGNALTKEIANQMETISENNKHQNV